MKVTKNIRKKKKKKKKNKDCNVSECVNSADQEQLAVIGVVGDGGFGAHTLLK